MRLKIAGAAVFDPDQGWEGEIRDLYVEGERLSPPLAPVDRVIDARHLAVVPGGIDLRGRVATYGLNFLRLWGQLPPAREVGETYALLGFTHVHEPYLTPATAAYVHRELAALPVVDASASLVVNLRDFDLALKDAGRRRELVETLEYLATRSKALNFWLLEPYVRHRREFYQHRNIGLEEALERLTELARELGSIFMLEASPALLRATLPDPAAFHLSGVGQALEEEALAEAAGLKAEAGVTLDMGLLWPVPESSGNGIPIRVDLGQEEPLSFLEAPDPEKGRRALRLALAAPGEQMAYSVAGPGGGIRHLPEFAAWLGDVKLRREHLGAELNGRCYSFSRWIYATRTLPARLLGLRDRGHLRPGARADLALYDFPPGAAENWPKLVTRCRLLIKGGEVVVEDYRLVRPEVPKNIYFRAAEASPTPLFLEFLGYRSLRPENFWPPEGLKDVTFVGI